jgi:hypothetical protein
LLLSVCTSFVFLGCRPPGRSAPLDEPLTIPKNKFLFFFSLVPMCQRTPMRVRAVALPLAFLLIPFPSIRGCKGNRFFIPTKLFKTFFENFFSPPPIPSANLPKRVQR